MKKTFNANLDAVLVGAVRLTLTSLLLVGANAWAANPIVAGSSNTMVSFINPETFNDMPWPLSEKEEVMNTLKTHFVKLGAQLPADQILKIEVTDIDLAGRIEPSAFFMTRSGNDLRILRGRADWPVINLRYSLESKGQVLSSGEEKIADMTYLDHLNRYSSSEALRYEKQMLDSWFQRKFQPVSR